ncbi:MAG: zinc-binding dehydrogenase [Pseudomonadota bacterium]
MTIVANVAVLPADSNSLRIEEISIPDPGPHQVVVRLHSSGICHSQLHTIHAPRETEQLLGHEATGTVVSTGNAVTDLNDGDTVVISWVPRENAMGGRRFDGVTLPTSQGEAKAPEVFTWADTTIVDEQFVVKVATDAPRDVSCIIGCAVMTGAGAVVNSVDIDAGDSVVVIGAGGVGLCAIAAARQVGADPIIAVDLEDNKLALAKSFGATHGINGAREHVVKAVHKLTGRDAGFTYLGAPISGADYVFDCIGLPETMNQAVSACRKGEFGIGKGGTAVLVGLPTGRVEFNPMDLIVSEKSLIGSFCGSCKPGTDIPKFLEWHLDGRLDLNALVTRRYRLDQINEAVADLEAGRIEGRGIIEF